jgi:hypothetical protein
LFIIGHCKIISDKRKVIKVDAFTLAEQFKGFVEREWSKPSAQRAQEEGDLLSYFEDWVTGGCGDEDMVATFACNHTLLLQTFIVVVAEFHRNPDGFSAIRDWVTGPLDLQADDEPSLSILNPEVWNRIVQKRLEG